MFLYLLQKKVLNIYLHNTDSTKWRFPEYSARV